MDQDQGKSYHTPELKKVGNVHEITRGEVDPISGQPNE